jgi:Protein of unknown function (DUF4239)
MSHFRNQWTTFASCSGPASNGGGRRSLRSLSSAEHPGRDDEGVQDRMQHWHRCQTPRARYGAARRLLCRHLRHPAALRELPGHPRAPQAGIASPRHALACPEPAETRRPRRPSQDARAHPSGMKRPPAPRHYPTAAFQPLPLAYSIGMRARASDRSPGAGRTGMLSAGREERSKGSRLGGELATHGEVILGITAFIAFACIFGGTLLGMRLHKKLPELNADTKEVVKLAAGLIVLICALVLGLLIASAKSQFEAQNTEIKKITANLILLDDILAQYGADADADRDLLRHATNILADRIWKEERVGEVPVGISGPTDALYNKFRELSPTNETQRALKARAIQVTDDIAQGRMVLFTLKDNSIPMVFVVVLIFWLTVIFAIFSLLAQPSPVVVGCLFICALSAASSVYLVMDLGRPFAGLIQIPSAPMRKALPPLGEPPLP